MAEVENTLEVLAFASVTGIVLIGIFILIYGIRERSKTVDVKDLDRDKPIPDADNR